MTYRNGVYDVTDFIAKHPGAQNIMLAAGGDVQPFWDIYSVHKGNEQACEQELMLTYLQVCKLKFRLRELTSCLCSAIALAICFGWSGRNKNRK